jgi:Flp pilus assembly protein TadB
MAQTKRKRRTKHRGTAAGTIETRGRTGRPVPTEQRKQTTRAQAREQRLNTAPTWKGSAIRAGFAAALMFAFIALTAKGSSRFTAAGFFAIFAFALYVPAGYYLETYMFRRRQRRKAVGK